MRTATRYAQPLTLTTRGLQTKDGTTVPNLGEHLRAMDGEGVIGQPVNLPVTVRIAEPGEMAAGAIDATIGAGTGLGVALQYSVRDSYGTTWEPGCFAATQPDLLDRAFPLLWMHSRWDPVGVFRVSEDTDTQLKIEIVWDDTTAGRDAYARARSGSAPGLSVGVMLFIDPSTDDPDLIRFAELIEVSQITLGQQAVPGAGMEEVRTQEDPAVTAALLADAEARIDLTRAEDEQAAVAEQAEATRSADADALDLARALLLLGQQ